MTRGGQERVTAGTHYCNHYIFSNCNGNEVTFFNYVTKPGTHYFFALLVPRYFRTVDPGSIPGRVIPKA